MLIVEELFLLMRRDDGKPASATAQRGYGLAAAVITDLVLAERITLSDDDKDPRMTVLAPGPVGHPALDAAMARLEQRDGKKLSTLVTDGKLNVEAQVADALADAGIVGIEEKRALGLVPAKYPVLDPEPERRTREQLRVVLAGGTPRTEDATLLAILQGLGIASTVLKDEKGTLGRRDLKQRIEEVTAEVKAGDAVARAVSSVNAAMMTVISSDGGDGGGGD